VKDEEEVEQDFGTGYVGDAVFVGGAADEHF